MSVHDDAEDGLFQEFEFVTCSLESGSLGDAWVDDEQHTVDERRKGQRHRTSQGAGVYR